VKIDLADLRLVVGSYDGTVRLWDAKSQAHKPLMVLSEAKDSISSVCVVEHEIMSGSIDGRVRVYDLRMGMVYIDVIGRECSSPPLSLPSTLYLLHYTPSHPPILPTHLRMLGLGTVVTPLHMG